MTWNVGQGLRALPAVCFLFIVLIGAGIYWSEKFKIGWWSVISTFILSLLGEFIWASLWQPGSPIGIMGFLLIVIFAHEFAKRILGPMDKKA